MDLSKLTPAPWKTALGEWGNGGVYPYVFSINHKTNADGLVDCRFIELARLAFDVMTRRGWGVKRFMGGWNVLILDDWSPITRHLCWPDPFTALVEADKWYKENVEKPQ